MTEWANKPNAVMHAEVMTTEAELDELFQFMQDNPMPRWQFCGGATPFPSRSKLTFYLDRGNPIIVARDQDNELWGYYIASLDDGYALWMHVRREIDEAHEPDVDNMTPNSRSSTAHMNALAWKIWGEGIRRIRLLVEPEFFDNTNLQHVGAQAIQDRIEAVYNEHYAD